MALIFLSSSGLSAAECSFRRDPAAFLEREARGQRLAFERLRWMTRAQAPGAPRRAEPASSLEPRNFIDEEIFGALRAKGVRSAALTTDEEFLRRVTLDLTGRLPLPNDIRAFLASEDPEKRDKVIDKLMGSRTEAGPVASGRVPETAALEFGLALSAFSFVLLDESVTPSRVIAARDPIGITTLYQGWHSSRPGATFFASELKALTDLCDKIISFPPDHVYDSRDQSTTRYYKPSWWNGDLDGPEAVIPEKPADLKLLRETLEEAVRKRLMSEVPYGVLLSGGLDSSLIASIAARETEKVAQAQAEARKRRLQEAKSGPPTPGEGNVDEARMFPGQPI